MNDKPDFQKWAAIIKGYPIEAVAKHLEWVYDLGVKVGESTPWYKDQDNDAEWQEAHGEGK